MRLKTNLLATGIGSLPFKEAEKAADLIFKTTPAIPYWPQLPARSPQEGMVAQFSEGIPCLKIKDKGVYCDNSLNKEEELALFYEKVINLDKNFVALSKNFAPGFYIFLEYLKNKDLKGVEFIKSQITGPFTFAASIKGEGNRAILYDEVLLDAVVNGLGLKALWQIEKLRAFNKKIILIFDEPYLGCFGSAFTPINKDDVIKTFDKLTSPLRDLDDVVLGIHCCGNTDWAMIMQLNLDIISFDAHKYFDRFFLYHDDLKPFFKRGGILAWGIVPALDFDRGINYKDIVEDFEKKIKVLSDKGIDRDILTQQAILTPSCGLASLDEKDAESASMLLSDASLNLRERYVK